MDHKKPSVLLRIGCKQVGHLRGRTFDRRDGKIQSACVVGMMIVAAAGSVDPNTCNELETEICDWLNGLRCPDDKSSLGERLVDLNDGVCLSPEEIADKIESMGF